MRGVQLIVGAVTLGLAAGYAWSAMPVTSHPGAPGAPVLAKPTPEEIEHSVYYARCADAWAAGKAPIFRGQPGYREALDGDSDGIACEPYRGR
jgi:hypothetical protein